MNPKPEKNKPKSPVHIHAANGAWRDGTWNGSISADALNTDALILFVAFDEVETGPDWHVHPYDEIFIITEGQARFTVGDDTFVAKQGDVITGPASIPHKYKNVGPGPLKSIDIHMSREWIQTDLADPHE